MGEQTAQPAKDIGDIGEIILLGTLMALVPD